MERQGAPSSATHSSATSSELKLWIVPRIDSRTLSSHRHAKETSFASVLEDLPAFVVHAKSLWNKVFHNDSLQQPTRPSSITGLGAVRFLSHSSVKSGWDHLKVAFYQMGKACHYCFPVAHVLSRVDQCQHNEIRERDNHSGKAVLGRSAAKRIEEIHCAAVQ
jgi:hypothetical protein